MITLDTSCVLALLNSAEPEHQTIKGTLVADRGPYLVPAGILAEVCYMVDVALGFDALDAFLTDLSAGAYTLEWASDGDIPRVLELQRRYRDLGLGFADATVIACAERNGGRILTLDRRHFDVVSAEGGIEILPL